MGFPILLRHLYIESGPRRQRFRIIDFLMGPWQPWAMILMGPRALGMGPIIDIFIHWKF